MDFVAIAVPHPVSADGEPRGVGTAPAAWQEAGLVGLLAPYATRALWVTLPAPQDCGPAGPVGRLGQTVSAVTSSAAIPLVLGGDPSTVSLGTILGLQRAGISPGVIWLAPRIDLERPDDPLTLLTRRQRLPTSLAPSTPSPVPEHHMLVAGHRPLPERTLTHLEDTAITTWSASDLRLAGGLELGRSLGDWPPLYLHFDLGVLESPIMPRTAKRDGDGISAETAVAAIESVAAAGRIVAAGIVGFRPELDEQDVALVTGLQMIQSIVSILSI